MRTLALLLPFLALALAQRVEVQPGWVRLVPPVLQDTAAYLTLLNRGDKPLRLLGGETPVARRVSLHRDQREQRDGHVVMGMRPLPYLDIPPKGRVELKPGGYHLMLEGLKRLLKAGEKVELTLVFQGGLKVKVLLPVEMR
ncbi:copper chaperone PCu(A)C [Thermus sp.]|uniref:copper chaperone PCu(A)C n=1 Tax=Thermus sp. TaxID=275 RepID=UPI00307F6487